jgi:glutamate-1-semialdehyde 2,1-aminomutase
MKPKKYLLSNKSKGQKLWIKAKKIIPNGNMFLSKKAELYLPNLWPAYYSSAKGCFVKDLDNKKYIDLTMSVGTNVLGYSNKNINQAAIDAIKNSTMSSLNSEEEVLLAQKMLKIHPWAGGIKFARTGGEANALSLRIARAYCKKTKVAFCGYHGWHDWYLSANLNKKRNLDQHLLKNLSTDGVPKELKNTVFPFEYGNKKQFLQIIKTKKIGIVKMEIARSTSPNINFLKLVRKICNKKKIVLIFDECTSGFRQNFGGMHKILKINPDIAVFGKSLGNGFAITAVIGKKKIMDKSKNSFMSSTFWSERLGYAAALETLNQMKKLKSWKKISYLGNYFRKKMNKIIKKNSLNIEIKGLLGIPTISFKDDHKNILKTLFTQEMLKSGFIINNSIYISVSHNKKIFDKFFITFEKFVKIIKNKSINEIKKLLLDKSSVSGFGRLN